MEQLSNDISHPVRDAFLELGHKAKTAAVGAYVTLPVLMASAPAYGHETGQAHVHASPQNVAHVAFGALVLGATLMRFGIHQLIRPDSEFQKEGYVAATIGGMLSIGSLTYLGFLRSL